MVNKIEVKIGRGTTKKFVEFIQESQTSSYFIVNGEKKFASKAQLLLVKEVKNNKDKTVGILTHYKNKLNMEWFVTVTEEGISSCRSLGTAVERFPILKREQKLLLKECLK